MALNDHNYAYNDFEMQPDPPHQPMYLRRILSRLKSHDQHVITVLDAGCGDGNFTASLAEAGFEVFGIDLSHSGIAIAQSREVGAFAVSSLYEDLLAPFSGRDAFDAVVSVEVIEHLYAPRRFVRMAFEALRPGGVLVLTTPYWGYLKNIVLAVTNRVDRALTPLWDGGHIKHWSRKTLTALLEEGGFEVVSFEGAGRPIPFLWSGMVLVARKPPQLSSGGQAETLRSE